jgi:hypothetical protein
VSDSNVIKLAQPGAFTKSRINNFHLKSAESQTVSWGSGATTVRLNNEYASVTIRNPGLIGHRSDVGKMAADPIGDGSRTLWTLEP